MSTRVRGRWERFLSVPGFAVYTYDGVRRGHVVLRNGEWSGFAVVNGRTVGAGSGRSEAPVRVLVSQMVKARP